MSSNTIDQSSTTNTTSSNFEFLIDFARFCNQLCNAGISDDQITEYITRLNNYNIIDDFATMLRRHQNLLDDTDYYTSDDDDEINSNAYAAAFDEGVYEFTTVPADGTVMTGLQRASVSVDDSVEAACSVCLEDLGEDTVVCVLPCDHMFHDDCIGQWFKYNHFCPLCRFEFPAAKGC